MGSRIPRVQTVNRELNQVQANIITAVNPVLSCNINYGAQLYNIALGVGSTPVNHGLGRELNGWFLVRKRGPAEIYDEYSTQDQTAYPLNKTIVFNSDAAVEVDIYVY